MSDNEGRLADGGRGGKAGEAGGAGRGSSSREGRGSSSKEGGGASSSSVVIGPDVKAHVLATRDLGELRIVLVKKDEKEGVVVNVVVQGESFGSLGGASVLC